MDLQNKQLCNEHLYQLVKDIITFSKLKEKLIMYRDMGLCYCCAYSIGIAKHVSCCDVTLSDEHVFSDNDNYADATVDLIPSLHGAMFDHDHSTVYVNSSQPPTHNNTQPSVSTLSAPQGSVVTRLKNPQSPLTYINAQPSSYLNNSHFFGYDQVWHQPSGGH